MQHSFYPTPDPKFLYIVARDAGYLIVKNAGIECATLKLQQIEDAIFKNLTTRPHLSYFTAICRTQAELAARRVWSQIPDYVKG